jgi:hypothetical protein
MGVVLSDLFTPEDVDELVQVWESHSIRLRARCFPSELFGISIDNCFDVLRRAPLDRVVVAAHQPAGGDEYVEVRPIQAEAIYLAGLTVCWKVVGLPQFTAFQHDLEQRLRLPGWSCNIYLSPDEDGFSVHYDRHATLVVQLSGAKEWWYSDSPTVPDPLQHFSQHSPPHRDELRHATLEPGDILFLPPSCWHMARAKGSSLALTFAPRESVSVAKQMLDTIWQPAPMPALSPEDYGEHGIPARARRHIEGELARMRAALEKLSVDDVWAHWFQIFAKPSPSPSPLPPRELRPTDELSLPSDYPVSTASRHDDGLEQRAVHCNGRAVSVGANTLVLLQIFFEVRRLTGEELVTRLGPEVAWADVGPLLGELVERGILEVYPDGRSMP